MKQKISLPKINNKMYSFSSIDHYRSFIEDSSVTKTKFLSKRKNQSEFKCKTIESNVLFSILNKEGCLSIGDYIYQIVPNKKQVWVIHKDCFSKNFIFKNHKNKYDRRIRKYSFNDDVLGMVESNTAPSNSKLFCRDSDCPTIYREETVSVENPNGETGDLQGRIHYLKLGLYFELLAKARVFCPDRSIEMHWDPIYYKQKCGYTNGPMSHWNFILGSKRETWYHYIFYQGMKPLTFFKFRIVLMAKYIPNYSYPDPSIDFTIQANI